MIEGGAHPRSVSVVIGAAGLSGLAGAVLSAPFDFAKTRMQAEVAVRV